MNDICREVISFLEGLRRDLPALFPRRPKCGTSPAFPSSDPVAWLPRNPEGGQVALAPCNTVVSQPPVYTTVNLTGIGRNKAGEIIKARIKSVGASMGLEYGRVFIKDQKTLWASCSGKRNLNFNWRLAAAPPEILDYVVIHELCHLREMNHSKRFWSLVGQSCPDYKAHKKWLKHHSHELRKESALPAPVSCNS